MTIIEIFKDWLVPILSIMLSFISVGLAIWFASSAKNDAQKAQMVLDNVNAAIEGWQKQIMASTVGILDSMPQVIEGKAALAKVEAAQSLTNGIQDAIHQIATNPQPGAAGHTQEEALKTLTKQLNELLASMVGASPQKT
ncbi:hypothetical protein [Microbulbifer variabilis]|uniref:hypothetical protein n=1 Tax=Microbulbifer variabilis TaxID=266805 RepID=UPI001CFF3A5E|nr:hypothetical protein [Microbulbifer variabilis]